MRAFFLLAFFALLAVGQIINEDKLLIDAFTDQTDTIVLIIPSSGLDDSDPPITDANYATGNFIQGTERDLELQIDSGVGNVVLTTGVSDGVYTSATPNQARGLSILTLDGQDASVAINPSGLFSDPENDWTFGDAFALRFFIRSDQPTTVYVDVYSGSINSYCAYELDIPGDNVDNEIILEYVDFADFGGGCDFSNVGALQIGVEMFDNVDVIISEITTWGPEETCVCFCPVFSCRIFYDPDDDTFSYYRTSQFGVFNPTTDFSTVNGPPPPNPSASNSPRPPGVSATRRPTVTVNTSDFSFSFSSSTNTNSNTNSNNNNSNNNNNSSSDASTLTVIGALIALVALMI